MSAEGPSARGAVVGRPIGWFLAHAIWSTEVVGTHHIPTTGPVLYAANHLGVMDGPVLIGASPRPLHCLVKEEMFTGALGMLLRGVGQIPVDRQGGRGALTASLAALKRGGVVGVFPEGNRGRGDAADARAGISWLALNAKAPVIPVAVLGTRFTGESVNHLPELRRRLAIEFGPPLTLERTPGVSGRDALSAANEILRVTLADLVASASARTGIPLPTDDPNRENPSA